MENYIFDFGMVLVRFDTEYMTKQFIKDSDDCKTAKDIIFDRTYWDRLDDGTITDSEVKECIKSRLPQRLWDSACKVYDNWYFNLPFIDGMVDLIKEIKATGSKLFVLSNISKGFAENYRKVPALEELFALFDGIVFSAPLGIVKPEVEIFEYLLEKYKLDRRKTAFIDDSEKNIKSARAIGINGYTFDGDSEKLRRWLFSKEN